MEPEDLTQSRKSRKEEKTQSRNSMPAHSVSASPAREPRRRAEALGPRFRCLFCVIDLRCLRLCVRFSYLTGTGLTRGRSGDSYLGGPVFGGRPGSLPGPRTAGPFGSCSFVLGPSGKLTMNQRIRLVEGNGISDVVEWLLEVDLLEDDSEGDRFGHDQDSIGDFTKRAVDKQDCASRGVLRPGQLGRPAKSDRRALFHPFPYMASRCWWASFSPAG